MGANLILPAGSAAAASTTADPVTRSLRFNSGAYLSRTFGTPTDAKKKTISVWVKRSRLNYSNEIISYQDSNAGGSWQFSGPNAGGSSVSDEFVINDRNATTGYSDYLMRTKQLFRDPAAWYHIFIRFDTTDSTAADRCQIWINGERITDWNTGDLDYPDLNYVTTKIFAATTGSQYIGASAWNTASGFDGYMADFYFTDGTAYDVTDFAETDSTTGQWVPKTPTGLTYGNNGFHIDAQPAHDAELLVSSIDRNDGDTAFADAAKGHVLTASGNTHHDNTVGNPFGSGTAIYFDGNGDTIVAAASSDFAFGTGDFTVEGWWYFESIPSSTDAMLVDFRPTNSTTTTSFAFSTDTTNGVKVYSGGNYALGGSLSTNTWHHIALVRNSGTLYAYIDGTATGTTQTLTANLSTNGTPRLGTTADGGTSAAFTGYIFDVRITKGTAQYTSSFTAPSAPFELNPVYIGGDQSGNKNHFTATNLASHDVMLDTPTNNYCLINSLAETKTDSSSYDANPTTGLSEGNLKLTSSSIWYNGHGTLGVSSGKWYFEWYSTGDYALGGFSTSEMFSNFSQSITDWWALYNRDSSNNIELRYKDGTSTAGTAWAGGSHASGNGNVYGCAFDVDNRKMYFHKNGEWSDGTSTLTSTFPSSYGGDLTGSSHNIPADTTFYPIVRAYTSSTVIANFGQDSTFANTVASGSANAADANGNGDFRYTPPSGYLALCASNLDGPTIKAHEHFAAAKYTGAGGSEEIDLGFTPNLTWIKRRVDSGYYHGLYDSARGLSAGALASNTTDAEDSTQRVASFDSDTGSEGFTLSSTHYSYTNTSGKTYISWNWKESASAGFDIVTYEGDSDTSGDTQSISHSLGVAPEMIIVKARDGRAANDYYARDYWYVWHKDLTSGSSLYLNDTSVEVDYSSGYTSAPISSVGSSTFTVCNAEEYNNYYYDFLNWGDPYGYYTGSNERYVAYLFSSVEGVSKVGSYTGNGSDDGPMVYCGFRPSLILAKAVNRSNSWYMWDDQRDGYNVTDAGLWADLNIAESNASTNKVDILSNGFKLRGSGNGTNSSTDNNYIFIAWAHSPFSKANSF